MSQNPKMARHFLPGSIGSTSPPFCIFVAIIVDPASPNPTASKAPILINKDSKIPVSKEAASLILSISF